MVYLGDNRHGSAIIQAVSLRRKMRFERQDDELKVRMLTEMPVDQVEMARKHVGILV